jgi:hypothetical protein
MYLGIAIKKAIEAGGRDVRDSKGRTWCVEPDGDISQTNPDVMKNSINNWWRGDDWCVVEEEKQPTPQPELMTGLQARCKVFAQGGGEIWFEAEGKTPEHRVTIGADCVVTKGTANGLTETQKVYTVRPLPLVTVAT